MLSFEQFLQETLEKGGSINTLFEERLFRLVGTLERIAGPLAAAKVPYELIGGGAVMVHVNRVEPSAVRNTKDVGIMVNRPDLEKIKEVAGRHGFALRHVASVDMLLPPGETRARMRFTLSSAAKGSDPTRRCRIRHCGRNTCRYTGLRSP